MAKRKQRELSAAAWKRYAAKLHRENQELRLIITGVIDPVVPYTAPQTIRKGDTVLVRVPKRFLPWPKSI